VNNLQDDLKRIIQADEEQVRKINSDFLKKQAHEIRRLAEKGESA
jgi:hypothetical protein